MLHTSTIQTTSRGSAIGPAQTPNSVCWQHEESHCGEQKMSGVSWSRNAESIAANRIVFVSVSKGWLPDRILNYFLAKPNPAGIVGVIRLRYSIRGLLRHADS